MCTRWRRKLWVSGWRNVRWRRENWGRRNWCV
ncbi:unnamed protein product [Linum tenue]|uniref:Uncharacterized protein n=1 Tax=Linum tenue TaxID=586396 RepID=A0AAV0L9A3_9ROSI|nr:unnamed protein product [Linum tenue]